MALMPGRVCKGKYIQQFEKYVNEGDKSANPAVEPKDWIKAKLDAYKGHTSNKKTDVHAVVYEFRDELNKVKGANEDPYEHITKHWFGKRSDPVWWNHDWPMGEIFIEALKRALLTCIAKPGNQAVSADDWMKSLKKRNGQWDDAKLRPDDELLTLDMYWVCAGGRFEMAVSETERQVVLMVLTPPPPMAYRASLWNDNSQSIWTVSAPSLEPGEQEVHHDKDKYIETVRPRTGTQNILSRLFDEEVEAAPAPAGRASGGTKKTAKKAARKKTTKKKTAKKKTKKKTAKRRR